MARSASAASAEPQTSVPRYDVMCVFDVQRGNPNGDPDMDNRPRQDLQTYQGLVSAPCLKRKIRNKVLQWHGGIAPYAIYVAEGTILEHTKTAAYEHLGFADLLKSKKPARSGDKVDRVKAYMCETYFDVRTFGAVMSENVTAGTVRGPVQVNMAVSVDPIEVQEMTITRMAVATEEESIKHNNANMTMGRSFSTPYGLYVGHLFVSPFNAGKTGFGPDDLEVLKRAVAAMFDDDMSAARGMMTMRHAFAFRHSSALGNARFADLFDLVQISRQPGVDPDGAEGRPPRAFSDYRISVARDKIPAGVTLEDWATAA